MKNALCVLVAILVFCSGIAAAETDITSLSLDELYALRVEINREIAARARAESVVQEGTSISEIFQDEWIAATVRDKLGKFSTGDTVTQEELDTITSLRISGQTTEHIEIASLEGIQYLRNIQKLEVWKQPAITELPEWIGSLTELRILSIRICPITSLPDSICNLINLQELTLDYTDISALPDDIGNLANLTTLDISYTKVASLPESIYGLELKTFYHSGLDIE